MGKPKFCSKGDYCPPMSAATSSGYWRLTEYRVNQVTCKHIGYQLVEKMLLLCAMSPP